MFVRESRYTIPMPSYVLYTVTGPRESYFAAVDPESGRVWTSPTRDGAIRDASAAGLTEFIEKRTTREGLLRVIGVGGKVSIPHEKPMAGPSGKTRKPAEAKAQWFIPGDGSAEAAASPLPLPKGDGTLPKKKKKPGKAGKKSPPFGSQTISGGTDDILIVPAPHEEH